MKKYSYLFFLFFFLQNPIIGQSFGFELRKDIDRIDIPFEFQNNFIVVNIIFNQTFPSKFIFDTGAEHTILCKRQLSDLLGIQYDRTFKVLGADLKTELTAYLAKGVSLKAENAKIEAPHQDILVLADDYFKLDEASGVKIAGILGGDMFNNYVVKINYVKKKITLIRPDNFVPPQDFDVLDLQVKGGRPYFFPMIKMNDKDSLPVKILIDTGAALSFLLFSNTHPYLQIPPQHIRGTLGMGLGGLVEGYAGKIMSLKLSQNHNFQPLICDFQDASLSLDSGVLARRNGILGEKILSQFHLYIDYTHEKLYLKQNTKKKVPIKYDRSGIVFIANGADLDIFTIHDIVPGSPASWAGLYKGDRLLYINNLSVGYYNLESLIRIFQGKKGKRIKLTVLRNGHKIKKRFYLNDLL